MFLFIINLNVMNRVCHKRVLIDPADLVHKGKKYLNLFLKYLCTYTDCGDKTSVYNNLLYYNRLIIQDDAYPG